METTLSVRLPKEAAEWLVERSNATGISKGKLVRMAIEQARLESEEPWMRLAGRVSGSPDLSTKEGFGPRASDSGHRTYRRVRRTA